MAGLTLDAGALIAAEKNDRRFWTFWKEATIRRTEIVVPATVVAQVWRGRQRARLALVLKACLIEPLDPVRAKAVGVLCGRARTRDVVDAHVALGAHARGDAVLTTDPDDLLRLVELPHPSPQILSLESLG